MDRSQNARDDEQRGGARSPAISSLYSMTTTSRTNNSNNDDTLSESGSSLGRSTTSSNGNLSLVRRAQEFELLLQRQGNVLGDFDDTRTPATDIEDDELESELQDLARSESMLRKELEIFATSFRRVGDSGPPSGGNVVVDDDDEEDTSTLPDLDDSAMLQEASTPTAWLQTPLSDVTTPGMAPWSPPISPPDFLDQQQHPRSGARVSLEEADLLPPAIETQQWQPSRLAGGPQLTPQWQRGGTTATGTTGGDSSPETDDDDGNVLGGIMPMGLTGSSSSSPLRRPQYLTSSVPRPARVSLEEDVPSLLNVSSTNVPTSVSSPSRHGALGPPTQRPSPILEGGDTASEYSNDSSLFADLTRLSSTTPRISNIGGKLPPGSSLSSQASSSRAPSLPSLTVETGPTTEARRSDYAWNEPPSPLTPSEGLTPFDYSSPVSASQSPPDLVSASHSPDVVEDDLLGLDTNYPDTSHEPSQAQREHMDALVGLLQPWTASSWKQPDDAVPMLYPTTALSPIMSVSIEEDMTSPDAQGGHGDEGQSSVFSFAMFTGRKRRRGSPFVRMNTSTEEDEFTQQRRRKPYRGLCLLGLLVFCVVCVIVVPTSIAVARGRDRTSSAAVGGGDGSNNTNSPSGVAGDEPTVSPRPSLRPTRSPTVAPSVSTLPSESPSESPSSLPTVSSRPSFSMHPSSQPAQPTTAQPTDVPSEAPSTSPSSSPSSTPSHRPSWSPTTQPSAFPTESPTIGPTHQPTAIPSPLPTVVPTGGPTFSPSVRPTPLPSAIPSTVPPTPVVLDASLLSFLRLISFDGGAALDDPTSPQYSAFLWLSQDPNLEFYDDERRTQRYAMATLYYSLNGESWLSNDGWLSEDDECTWFSRVNRQICGRRRLQPSRPSSSAGSIIRLVLYYNNLEGAIPPEIAHLTHLEEIHLMGGPTNYISGSLPSELGYMVNLRDVQLSDNRLTGNLPSTLEAWHEMQYLDLSKNALSGRLTNEVVGGWSALTELHLSSNLFTGPMPLTWAQSLVFLELDNNSLTGPLPASMGNLQDLRLLSLDYNRFTSLPSGLVSLIVLEDFSIVGNELAGPLMPELGFLPRLRSLRLSNNTLTSTIPTEFGELARLISVLDLSNNELEGEIPSQLGQINDRLRSLRLSGNRLSGSLPASLANLNRLAEIRLEDNDLTGAVPVEVCDVWYEELPTVYADCGEIDCPCCNFCCIDGEGCLCRYADDPELAWRCY